MIVLLQKSTIRLHVENLLDEIWKLVNLVSYVNKQRGSPDPTFEIFHNIYWSSCLLDLRGGMHLAT